jgi:conjugal transfer pilus assembly protein TraB
MANSNNKKQELIAKAYVLMQMAKRRPVLLGGLIGLAILLFVVGVGSKDKELQVPAASTVAFEGKESSMVGVKESVDPRDVWVGTVVQKVETSAADFSKKLEEAKEAQNLELGKVQGELAELKALLTKQQETLERRELEESLSQTNTIQTNETDKIKNTQKSLGLFTKGYGAKKKNVKDYVTSGSFARAVLMTGVVVGTGSNSQSNPEPVMMRLTDSGIFSKGKRTDQIKEAILIGDCSGDLSSERAKCRLQTLSLENYKGEIIERPIKGWIVGEDGRNGVKGMVIDKSSDILRMAMLNGVLGGMSNFLQNQSTKGVFPISPITGQQNALDGMAQLKGGMASGAGDAFSKMADFVMERFNSMSPQIVIASGREVDVVFQHGVDLNGESDSESEKPSDGNLSGSYNNPPPAITAQAKAFQKTMQQVNKMKSQEGQNVF